MAEFLPPVTGCGAGRQHFRDELGPGLDHRAGQVERAAGHQHVGVKVAAGGGEVLAQGKSQIHGHRHRPVFGTRHGEDFAVDVFMAIELRRFPSQLVGYGKNVFYATFTKAMSSGMNRRFSLPLQRSGPLG